MRSVFARFQRLGLQRRIMLYVTAGLVVFSAIFGFVALRAIEQATDLVFRERQLVARTVAREIDDDLAHVLKELEDANASLSPMLAANNLAETQNFLRTLYTHWTIFDGFAPPCMLLLTDARGQVLWTDPNEYNLIGRDLSPRPYLQDVFQSQRTTITNGIAPDSSGRPMVTFTIPIRAETGVNGFLVGEIDRTHFGRRLASSLDMGEEGYAVELIDEGGIVIASNAKGKQFSSSPHLQLIASFSRAGQSGVRTHTFSFDGGTRNHVIAFAPLTRITWGIVVEQEADEALILPRNLQTEFIAFGLLALFGGLGLAWLTTRTVVRPVNVLIHASQEISQGNLDHPLDRSGGDEVGMLARTFDEMRVALRQSREEIAGWNRELEARVQQRTRELTALVESSHALTSTLELDALFDIVISQTRSVVPAAEGIALFLFDDKPQLLALRSTFGFDASECAQIRFRVGEAIAGKIFDSQKPALVKTAVEVQAAQANFSEENRRHFRRAVGDRTVQSALGVPLVSKSARLGALMLYNFARQAAFTEGDVPILQALADQAATAIENARLYQEAREVGALRELNRLKSEFAARASHELRTPLTAIKSLAESLLRRELNLDAATQQEFLQGIDTATDRLSKIVDQLLTLARVESGILEIRREPVDIGALTARVVAQFRAQAPQRAIEVSLAPDLPLALGDAERVEDVLTNLLSNALKYSNADTSASVCAELRSGAVVVSVADEGIGIPPEARGKIFERFYRVDNALTRRVGGAGLGLYICKTYVEAMGGKIWVADSNGQGSTISFNLPMA